MTKYTEIKGQAIQATSGGNPNDLIPGQVWYDGEAYGFKVAVEEAGSPAWSSGGNLGTARTALAGAGTQSAGLAFGGINGSYENVNATEEYNGSTWTAGGNMGTARSVLGGAGTQIAGLAIGGKEGSPTFSATNKTEEYDGSSWTTGGNLTTNRENTAGAGTQTSGLAIGDKYNDISEEYDGTSWSNEGAMPFTNKNAFTGCGTQTAALSFGGYDGVSNVSTHEYDGSTWTSGGSLSTGRTLHAGAGTQIAALAIAGRIPGIPTEFEFTTTNLTEEYNGTSWSSGGNLGTARYYLGGAGIQSAGLAFGGNDGSFTGATEEYSAGPTTTIKSITVS